MGLIITPDGMIPGEGDKPARPPTMPERLRVQLVQALDRIELLEKINKVAPPEPPK